MTAQVERIYIGDKSRSRVTRIERAMLVANKGIVGDRYHSRSMQAEGVSPVKNISLISREVLDTFLANNDADIDYGDFRRNIITSGIDLNSLIGAQFLIGNVLCTGTELCEPCKFLAATVHTAVLPELINRGGLRATVLSDGEILTGSEIKLVDEKIND